MRRCVVAAAPTARSSSRRSSSWSRPPSASWVHPDSAAGWSTGSAAATVSLPMIRTAARDRACPRPRLRWWPRGAARRRPRSGGYRALLDAKSKPTTRGAGELALRRRDDLHLAGVGVDPLQPRRGLARIVLEQLPAEPRLARLVEGAADCGEFGRHSAFAERMSLPVADQEPEIGCLAAQLFQLGRRSQDQVAARVARDRALDDFDHAIFVAAGEHEPRAHTMPRRRRQRAPRAAPPGAPAGASSAVSAGNRDRRACSFGSFFSR